jgi:hypothetical protein
MNAFVFFGGLIGGGSLAAALGAVAYLAWKARPLVGFEDPMGVGAGLETDPAEADGSAFAAMFSLDRYAHLEGLLSDDDLRFLQSQPGFRPEMAKSWNRRRQEIFRAYLTDLKMDFARLHAMAREMAAHGGEESAPMISLLMKQQLAFWRVSTALEIRLTLQSLGIGRVDLRPLLEVMNAMQADLVRAAQPNAA